ncbi:hypothetical protein KIN20_037121 [Parelaphostrongylus tenuis]|uniref:Uncharacterized protein n=1 Tax=Parelaphostrongylus tenuis TaxID=148309 RepID=A0AAD5WKX9_PARTN|nr:hypothetical protein KIN20_037121 [Parelaphostrongylus tenuis]
MEVEHMTRPSGILASALWEMRSEQNGMDPPYQRRRTRSVDGNRGILATALREIRATLKELEDDRKQESSRIGILGTALQEMKDIPYSKIEEALRPKSANNGMIALLLRSEDEVELANLGLMELLRGDKKKTSYKDSTEDEDATPNKKLFIPKMRSRESTASSEESQRTSRTEYSKTAVSHSSVHQLPTAMQSTMLEPRPPTQEAQLDDPLKKLLYMAKYEKWSEVDAELKKMGEIDLLMTDENGFTILLLAVKEGKFQLFQKVLSKGADINVVTKDNYNAAHICAMYSDIVMLNAIIAKNRDLLRRQGGPNLQLPIHLASERKSKAAYFIVRRILDLFEQQVLEADGNGSLPIHLALKAGNLQQAELLLSHYSHQQSTSTDGAGNTLLHHACMSGSMDAVRVAIAAGCDNANKQNAVGRTALHEVAYLGDANLLKIMFKLHADANIHDKLRPQSADLTRKNTFADIESGL